MMTTQKQVREAFWEDHHGLNRAAIMYGEQLIEARQNQYNADIRTAFVDYVDHLQKSGVISEKLAERVTL